MKNLSRPGAADLTDDEIIAAALGKPKRARREYPSPHSANDDAESDQDIKRLREQVEALQSKFSRGQK